MDDFLEGLEWGPDYEVTCDRCGLVLMASEAVPEEGDEWECEPCNEYWNRVEESRL